MDTDVVAIGEVTDGMLLLCGKPDSMPSTWWTPSLEDLSADQRKVLMEGIEQLFVDVGARHPHTDALVGPLGEVVTVIDAARLVVLIETAVTLPTGEQVSERRSVVVAEDRALLDRQDPEDGIHDLLLADPRSALGLLADLLTPARPTTDAVRALAGRRSPAEVTAALPEHERLVTTRVTRTAVAGDEEPGGVHMVTLVEHEAGAVACWALPEGDVQVQVLDRTTVVDVALALLGADTVEVVA